MPDLLVLSVDTESYFALEALGKELGFRVKASADLATAKEWVRLRRFSVVLVDQSFEISALQELASLLWKNSPQSPFVVFDLGKENEKVAREVRLFGADSAFGKQALSQIRHILERTKKERDSKQSPVKILVVEDLDSPRDIICFYVESMGFGEVNGVASAKEAIQLLEANPGAYSCVITDIRMPEVTGRDLIEFIRKHDKLRHLPVVALTAYGTVDTLIECLKAGASGFLVKPPKRDDLTRELARAVRTNARGESPRLADEQEAELLRELLIEKGFS